MNAANMSSTSTLQSRPPLVGTGEAATRSVALAASFSLPPPPRALPCLHPRLPTPALSTSAPRRTPYVAPSSLDWAGLAT
jgi:hypothetical protein